MGQGLTMAVVTAGIIAGGASLLGGVIGDMTSASGAAQTNETNMQIAQMNNTFNAQQAALNRTFQQQSQAQAEDFNANMADTQIQRRQQDLEAAGLNPQLAVGNPAAAPTISPLGGSTAQSAGLPNIQNPSAAYGQLGQQTAAAINTGLQAETTAAQVNLANKQALKVQSETPTTKPQEGDDPTQGVTIGQGNHLLGDATLANINQNTDLQTAQKEQVAANIQLTESLVGKADADTAVALVTAKLQGQQLQVLLATKDAIIKQAQAKGIEASNIMTVYGGAYGKIISYINSALPGINTAISAAAAARGGLGGATGARVTQNPNWAGDTSDDWKDFHLPTQGQ